MIRAVGAGQLQQATVEQGTVYRGTVTGWDPDSQMYTVNVRGLDVRALYAAGICSRLLGIQTRFRIPAGTVVELVRTDERALIVGTQPSNEWYPGNEKDVGLEAETADGSGDFPTTGDVWARDLLSGELDMTNALHAGIQLLTTFARLQGGDRALVETHVLDDLVRIVSGAFRHHSAFGDQNIYEQEGRVNSVEHGTSYDHEAWGAEDADGPKFESEDGKPDPETVAATGRWRYSRFLGYLGDFVHLMVSDPVQGLGRLGQDALRAGKARVQIQSDGSLLAQSVGDIVLERVCRVQIPVQLSEPQQLPPEVEEQLAQAETRFSRIWEGLQEEATLQDLAAFSYQLREYGRWLGSYQSLARFATDGRWSIPSEAQTPAPTWTNGERDRELANEGRMTHLDVYACIRIMRDGSIVVHSGDGSSLVMAGGSIQAHATRTLELSAGGDVLIRAGRDLLMDGRRHVRVMAVVGSLTLKARTFWHALCEFGTMRWDALSDDTTYEPEDGDPEPVTDGPALDIQVGGQTRFQALNRILFRSTGSDNDGQDPDEGGIEFHTPGAGVRVQARGPFTVYAQEMWTWLTGAWNLKAGAMFMDVLGLFRIRDRLTLRGGTLQVQRVQSQVLDAQAALLAPEAPQAAQNVGMGGRTARTGQDAGTVGDYHTEPDSSGTWDRLRDETVPGDPESEGGDRVQEWEGPLDEHRETLTDQFIRLEGWNGLWPDEWIPDTWTPAQARYRTRGQTVDPYPGAWTRHLQYSGGQSLNEPDSTEHQDLTTGTQSYTSQPTVWNYFNLQES